MMKTVINVAMYQLIWFLSVFFGNVGALGGLFVIALHFVLSDIKAEDLRMAGFLLLLGLVVDGTLVQLGFFSFESPGFPIPLWLMVIWLGLAITPNHSLSWMKYKPVLSFFFGAIGGPAAYWAGVSMGAAIFHWQLSASLIVLSGIWGIMWPVIMKFSVVGGGGRAQLGT